MSKAHQFGGPWTDEKVKRLAEYLAQYTKIFTKNEKAQYYETHYVDGFAGSGYRATGGTADDRELQADVLFDNDSLRLQKGSARLALEVEPPFDHYLLIEKHRGRSLALHSLANDLPDRANRVQVVQAEANSYLSNWAEKIDWKRNRAVVFLDAYGLEVDWSTLVALASTKAVDLWYLLPLFGFNRLLTRDGYPPETFANRLTRSLGTDDWKNVFYVRSGQTHLFEEEDDAVRNVDIVALERFFVMRLQTVFPGVAKKTYILQNSRRSPLYALCFACANPAKYDVAIRIANHILGK